MDQLRYFYHPDHLSSSSWITDGTGNAIQHLHYLPFGEDWVNQRNSSWNAPYTFSGKEKDAETGYGYFGARYYDSGLSIWLSVDPMSDKYPNLSPYNYCANNPVMLVDPDGRIMKIKGEDGVSIVYSPNMKYEGSDIFTKFAIEVTDLMYKSVAGKFVLDKLIASHKTYTITNEPASVGGATASKDGTCMNGTKIYRAFFHEYFHLYQFECGQGGRTVENEIEAMIFENIVSTDPNVNLPADYSPLALLSIDFASLSKTRQKEVSNYKNASNSLNFLNPVTSQNFNINFETIAQGFLNYASVGDFYKRLDYKRALPNSRKKNLVKQFYPIIK